MPKTLAELNGVFKSHNAAVKQASTAAAKERVSRNVFNALRESFGQVTDAQARTRPGMFHHVYEWGSVGQQQARLFAITSSGRGTGSFTMSYKFLNSSQPVPGSEPHIFVEKARVMEENNPVVIEPINSTVLSFEYDGQQVFTPGPVVVDDPGGVGTTNAFSDAFRTFFSSSVINRNPAYTSVIKAEKEKIIKSISRAR